MSVYSRRLVATVAASSAAAPGTTTTILAAPGVGFRYRVYGISCRRNTVNIAQTAQHWFSGTTSLGMIGQSDSQQAKTKYLSDVGIPCPENTSIQVNRISTAVHTGVCKVIYSTENV